MEVKIKQGNEMLDATIEMVDGVMVVSPKEGEEIWLPLYYASPSEFGPIKSLLNKGRDKAILDKGWCFKTEEECQAFCDRLNEVVNSVKP